MSYCSSVLVCAWVPISAKSSNQKPALHLETPKHSGRSVQRLHHPMLLATVEKEKRGRPSGSGTIT
jgi:hypothetical protein